jgi:CubicO group peptidase (beta-lactamase class C family)
VVLGEQPAVWRHLEQLIAAGMKADKVAGLSIAVVDDQKVIWSYGAGWANAATQLPATDQTVYRMGSISKLFTSTAAMQLAQKGQLDIDAPVQTILPGFRVQSPAGQPAITPRLLMTHHAGLTRDVGAGMWGSQVGRYQDMVLGLAPAAQIYPAGLLFSYSNVGMTVLGAAVEQAAQTPFETHIQRTLLAPLGMATASFTQASGPEVACAHKDGKVVNEPALRDTPAGGLNASVLDMSRFMMMVLANGKAPGGQTILEPAQLAEMLTVQSLGNALDFDLRIGLGWMLNSIGPDTLRSAGPVIHHGGATVNFHSQMYLLPEHKLGVIVAANSASAGKLVDSVAKRALGMVLAAKTGIQQPPLEPPFAPSSVPWADEQLQAWEGDYATVMGHARVVREGTQLKAHTGAQVLDLVPGDNGSMGLSYKVLGLVTLPIKELQQVRLLRRQVDGRPLLVARLGGQEVLIGERFTARPDARAAQWLGSYTPQAKSNGEQPVERITLSLDHDVLLAHVRMTKIEGGAEEILPIRLVSEREARVLRPLADFGEVVHWREVNGQPGFEVSGIVFVRSQS